jgi:hypothetical protein
VGVAREVYRYGGENFRRYRGGYFGGGFRVGGFDGGGLVVVAAIVKAWRL